MTKRRDRTGAILRGVQGVMRHTVGADRVATRRATKLEARGAQPAAVAVPAVEAAPAKKPMHVTDGVLARARGLRPAEPRTGRRGGENPFTPYVPAPGVLPANTAPMAFDEANASGFAQVASWGWDGPGGAQFSEGIGFLGFAYLSELTQRPEYRRMSERIATEMTREWIELNATGNGKKKKQRKKPLAPGEDPPPEEEPSAAERRQADGKTEKLKAIDDELQRLKVKDAFYNGAEQDGWFGRSHIYLDLGTTDDREELRTSIGNGRNDISKAKVTKGSLKRLQVVEPIWCYPAFYNAVNPLKANWYKPERWYAQGTELHSSRLLRFVGREVPDILKPAYAFGGLAMSQMAKPYVDNWIRTRQAVANLIESFSVSGVYTNMAGTIQDGGDEAMRRIDLFNLMRSNSGTFTLDKETEEFFNVSTPLGTLDDLQAQSQEQMSSVSGIPLVILLGITPKGLNASSEGEIRAFYDWIHAYQESLFRDHLQTVIDFVQLSLFGKVDPDIGFVFKPLWSMTEKEEAEVDKLEAEADQIRIDSGVLHPEEPRKALAAKPGSRYADIDVEDVPEPPEPDDGGDNAGGDDTNSDGGSEKPGAEAAFDARAPFRRTKRKAV